MEQDHNGTTDFDFAKSPTVANALASGTQTSSSSIASSAWPAEAMMEEEEEVSQETIEVQNKIAKMRFYEKQYPEVDDLVMTRVEKITDIGVTATLLEYGGIEGVVLMSDIAKRRMRSVTQHLRPGQTVVLQVLRVDPEKGYIDLSKKLVQPDDERACLQWFTKSKKVHSILGHVAHSLEVEAATTNEPALTLEQLCQKISWPLYKKYDHALDAFEKIANGEPVELEDLSPRVKELLVKHIKQRLGAKPVKLQADVQVTCFTPAGINGIKPALKAAEEEGTKLLMSLNDAAGPLTKVKVHLVRSPEYILIVTCKDPEKGVTILNKAIDACQTEIRKHGGDCVVKTPPRIVG